MRSSSRPREGDDANPQECSDEEGEMVRGARQRTSVDGHVPYPRDETGVHDDEAPDDEGGDGQPHSTK